MTRMASGLLAWGGVLRRPAMAKRKLHFERIPVETVRKIAKLDLPDTDQDGTRRLKEKCRSERLVASRVRARRNI